MTALNPSDIARLRYDGAYMLRDFAALISEATFWGMYLVVFVFAVHRMRTRRSKTRAGKAVLIISILLFSMSTLQLAISLFTFYFQLKKTRLTPEPWTQTAFDRNRTAWARTVRAQFAGNLMFSLEFLIGDAVIVWRTWVLWQCNLVRYLPIILWFASLGTFVAERIDYVASGGYAEDLQSPGDSSGIMSLSIAMFVLSIATNAVSTAMIAYRAWMYRQSFKQALGTTVSSVDRIFALLIESGMIYLLFWTLSILTAIPADSMSNSLRTFRAVCSKNRGSFVGLYPTLIIIIIELQHSVQDTITTVSLSPSMLSTVSVQASSEGSDLMETHAEARDS